MSAERKIYSDDELRAVCNDEHPKGAYDPDGRKLALVNCGCRFCVQEYMDRSERHPFY